MSPFFHMATDPEREDTSVLVTCSRLAEMHSNPRDKRLRFVSSTHTYYVDEIAVKCSVTMLQSKVHVG
jgi:hypothetical protein